MRPRTSYDKDEYTIVITSLSDSEDDLQDRDQEKAFSIIDKMDKVPETVYQPRLHLSSPTTDLVLWKPQESWSLLPSETFKSFIGQKTLPQQIKQGDHVDEIRPASLKPLEVDPDAMDLDI
ncbi:hypothetical protein NEOLI_002884 [Neolecta irregularis DAH-3]|uniref:Uncharacterized protein n=1 Tax=Neolecta irregularis (strain DAH-3) TaxID=1198029 RepID=A0A1U7LJK7_NEOID|nr:hypothetical protein NEOLI_002884 [Neolecta irregularis DAH-3]|eukprot:OLL22732.1 hypothetical protein NEOLI_002884 [Neolecta irregularis DAH-3]